MKPLFSIPDKDTAVKVIGWYASGRGIRIWKSHDLGANRPDLLTPADAEKPHWAYCSYVDVTPEQIEVLDREYYVQPASIFPDCDRCRGTGRRSWADLAEIRKQTIEACMKDLKDRSFAFDDDGDTFRCNCCKGEGVSRQRLMVRVQREYWGGTTPVGATRYGDGSIEPPRKVAKAIKLIEAVNGITGLKWDWGYPEEGNMAEVTFFLEQSCLLSEFMEPLVVA